MSRSLGEDQELIAELRSGDDDGEDSTRSMRSSSTSSSSVAEDPKKLKFKDNSNKSGLTSIKEESSHADLPMKKGTGERVKDLVLKSFYDMIGENPPEDISSAELRGRGGSTKAPLENEKDPNKDMDAVDFTDPDPHAMHQNGRQDGEKDEDTKNIPLDKNPEYIRALIKKLNSSANERKGDSAMDDEADGQGTDCDSSNEEDDSQSMFWSHGSSVLCDYVIIAKGENDPKWDILRSRMVELDEEGTEAKREAVEMKQGGEYHTTPLHLALRRKPPLDVVKWLVSSSPRMLAWGDRNDVHCEWLPLHCAVDYNASSAVIEYLVDWYPDARVKRTKRLQNTPLHFHCNFQQFHDETSEGEKSKVMRILSGDAEAVNSRNRDHLTPLDTFLMTASYLRTDENVHRKECQECLRILTSKTNLARDDDFYRSSNHVQSLHSAPQWLKEQALTHSDVQKYLNEKMCQTLATVIFMADLYANVFLISGFTITANSAVPTRYDSPGAAHDSMGWNIFLFVPIGYMVIREAFHSYSDGLSRWLSNPWNLLDVCHSVLTFTSTLIMLLPNLVGETGNDSVRILITITGGLVWIMGLVFLKAAYKPFSVFVSGFLYIIVALVPFLVATFLIIGAFGFMYYINTESTFTCQHAMQDEFPRESSIFCTYSGAFVHAFYMFIAGFGEFYLVNGGVQDPPGYVEEYYNSGVLALSVVYGFLVTTLLRSMVIAIVTDAWSAVRGRGVPVFWMHRLNFLAEVDLIRCHILYFSCRDQRECGKKGREKGDGDSQWDIFWEIVFLSFANHHDGSIVWEEADKFEKFKYSSWICGFQSKSDWRRIEGGVWLRRVLFAFLIFFWAMAGLATFGWLWPEKARRFILCPSVKDSDDETAQAVEDTTTGGDAGKETEEDQGQTEMIEKLIKIQSDLLDQVTQMKKELSKLKAEGTNS